MKEIDLTDCVQFVHEEVDEKGLTELLEREHNKWFNYEATKPLWRVVVVNHVHVLFVFHHAICDGWSGVLFHQSLLSALNIPPDREGKEESSLVALTTQVTIPESAPTVDKRSDISGNESQYFGYYIDLCIGLAHAFFLRWHFQSFFQMLY